MDLLASEGGAGLGFAVRAANSPYVGGGMRYDFEPLYLYENGRFYLHAYRLGLKLNEHEHERFDLFLEHRFEGYPSDHVPASLAGMADRGPGIDGGLSYERYFGWGTVYAEALRDVSHTSGGSELRLGYNYDWARGRLRLRPYFSISFRSERLNDYYYGVLASEATPTRPAYDPGAGFNGELGLYGYYRLTERWRLLAGASATRWSSGVRASPIVDNRVQVSGMVGAAYDFSPDRETLPSGRPLIVKLLRGKSTDCNELPIMTLRCTSTQTADGTGIAGVELGRPLLQKLNGWPLDFVGYVGLIRHDENGLQPDSWEFDASVKAYWYGFPWSDRVRTRIGFGSGLSYAQRVPYVEARDQARRGRPTSRLLNYADPTIDVSLGDLLGVRSLREAYFGFGVSHRSGIFGSSQLLGNVNGGSNYIYSYVEWTL
ncbi:MAG TPA: MipA/OmpV family protein [Burkholderiales bacterium]|nr:MipA/OmpV family protein [Burkholderiales bacterium]